MGNNMRLFGLSIISLFALSLSSLAFSADIEAGKIIANQRCASCHGAAGISPNDLWPNLAGQKATYLEKQIKAFRDKTRNDPMMSAISAGITDEQATNIAAYFAQLK
jgi:cytochrome c553